MLIATALAETVTENVSFLEGLWNNISPKLMDGTANFWETIYGEIYRNVIMEGRWLSYLKGLGVTLEVSFLAALVGVVLGTVLALMKLSKSSWLSKPASAYIHLIRSTPLLLQVLIINFGIFAAVNVDKIIVGVIACGLNSAAYVAELIRGGIESVDKGQTEAGRSLGLNGWQTMRLIVLPQALKTAVHRADQGTFRAGLHCAHRSYQGSGLHSQPHLLAVYFLHCVCAALPGGHLYFHKAGGQTGKEAA